MHVLSYIVTIVLLVVFFDWLDYRFASKRRG